MTDSNGQLIELEHRLELFAQLQTERNARMKEIIADLRKHSEHQDAEIIRKIERIHTLIWQVIRWAIVALTGTLITIVLKALNLL